MKSKSPRCGSRGRSETTPATSLLVGSDNRPGAMLTRTRVSMLGLPFLGRSNPCTSHAHVSTREHGTQRQYLSYYAASFFSRKYRAFCVRVSVRRIGGFGGSCFTRRGHSRL